MGLVTLICEVVDRKPAVDAKGPEDTSNKSRYTKQEETKGDTWNREGDIRNRKRYMEGDIRNRKRYMEGDIRSREIIKKRRIKERGMAAGKDLL